MKKPIFLVVVISVVILIPLMWLGYQQITYKPHPGSCKILEEKYCKQVVFVPSPANKSVIVAAYSLPKGTPVYAPLTNTLNLASKGTPKANGGTLPYSVIILSSPISTENNIQLATEYDFYFQFAISGKHDVVEKQVIDTVPDVPAMEGEKYNLYVSVIQTKNSLEHPPKFPFEKKDVTQDALAKK